MKIIDRLHQALDEGRIVYSFEYFPPKTDAGVQNLYDRLQRMKEYKPLFVDVTWGAGGSTSTMTMELCTSIQNIIGMEAQMHLTCTNMPKEKVDQALKHCKEVGIRNILALRGDPPAGQERWEAVEGGFAHASDLVRYIRREYGDYFGIAVAGYPEGHPECTDYQADLQHLKEKVDAGADFIVTQLFFDCDKFLQFVQDCRALGIHCPIIPGILPISNYQSFRRFTQFCKTHIPAQIEEELAALRTDDDEAVKEYGIKLGIRMCQYLMERGVRALHFYTLNLEKSVTSIIEGLHLAPSRKRSVPWEPSQTRDEEVRPIFWSNRPTSYLARTSMWDEFPNGRWGDRRSPAYAALEHHYLCQPKISTAERLAMWGAEPSSEADLQEVFVKFIRGQVAVLPWSLVPMNEETKLISEPLLSLNSRGFWTINSQPSVNGAVSTDPAVGWGPENGYVYQKAYIEFFCSPDKFETLRARLEDRARFPSLTYQATNMRGDVTHSNCSHVTAVTWGVFPGREILQPTVVDPKSFDAWKDEAFALWVDEWGKLYADDSASRALIQRVCDTYLLVNIVDNDFVRGNIYAVFEDL